MYLNMLINFPIKNITLAYLAAFNKCFKEYEDGWCGPLTYEVSNWLTILSIKHRRLMLTRHKSDGTTLYPTPNHNGWWYHSVIEVDGVIHDPWFNNCIALEDYKAKMFNGQLLVVEEDYTFCINKY